MRVLALDPGPKETAYVVWDGSKIEEMGNTANDDLVTCLQFWPVRRPHHCAIEQIRGCKTGKAEILDTCWWGGRFFQAWGTGAVMVSRQQIVKSLGYSGYGNKDTYVRKALIARFGPPGTKVHGVLHGVTGHLWAAAALAITFHDSVK